jgi:uncharacterized membrane protein YadS
MPLGPTIEKPTAAENVMSPPVAVILTVNVLVKVIVFAYPVQIKLLQLAPEVIVHAGLDASKVASVLTVGTPLPDPSVSQLDAVPQFESVVPLHVGIIQ